MISSILYHTYIRQVNKRQVKFCSTKIEGLNPPAGTISTSSYAGMNLSLIHI